MRNAKGVPPEPSSAEAPVPHLVGVTNAREKQIVQHVALWQAFVCGVMYVVQTAVLLHLWRRVQTQGYSPTLGKRLVFIGLLAAAALGGAAWFLGRWLKQFKAS